MSFSGFSCPVFIVIITTSRYARPVGRGDMPSYRIIITDCTLSPKRSISACKMYSPICVEWGDDHFGVSLTNRSTFDEDKREKRFLRFHSW